MQPHSQGPLLPVPWSERHRERERETLENAGHVSPSKKKFPRWGPCFFFFHYSCLANPSRYVMFCHLPDSWRHVTSVFQGVSLSLSLQGTGRREPGNAVVKVAESIGFCKKRSHGTWWWASSLLFPHWNIKTKRPEPVKLDQQ